jgi:DNA-binding CsgD family transcriptional regulator
MEREVFDLTTDAASPDAVRTAVLDRLLEAEVGDVSLYYSFARLREWTVPAGPVVRGHEAFAHGVKQLPWDRLRLPRWSAAAVPSKLRRSEVTAFVEGQRVASRREIETMEHFQSVWIPYGLEDQVRLLLHDGQRLVGWVGLFRRRAEGWFTAADAKRLSRHKDWAEAMLLHAYRVERSGLPAETGDALVDARGRVQFASDAGWVWLRQPGMLEALQEAIEAAERREPRSRASDQLLRLARARILRMHSERGGHHYLVTLRVTEPPPTPPARLSPRERQVADALTAGEHVKSTAASLGLSPETVKEYRKGLYRKLGVRSASAAAARWSELCAGHEADHDDE